MRIAITLLRWVLGFIYFFMKLFPTDKNRVVFLSRQSDKPTEDFVFLEKRLKEKKPDIKTVMITKRADRGVKSLVRFAFATLKSMRYLATSSVCVLDAYWPAVSLLKHKPSLTVIQLWHAMGKIKKSGYQSVGKQFGRSETLAKELRMHKNYDVIIAGGKAFNPFYCDSFGVEEGVLYNVGLPRMDMLRENVEKCRADFAEAYPELAGKKIVLYAPTFRKGRPLEPEAIIRAFSGSDSVLVIKPHPNQTVRLPEGVSAQFCEKLPTSCLLSVCDMLISDYSAISIEAAVLSKPICFYLFDYEDYIENNGLNVMLSDEFSACVFSEAEPLRQYIDSGEYDWESYERFRKKYLPELSGRASDKIAELMIDCMERDKNEAISNRLSAQN